jgi:large subunit ribosomal protein L25
MTVVRELPVRPRTIFRKHTKRLRQDGQIPGVVYGHHEASTPIQLDSRTFERFNREHSFRSVVALCGLQSKRETALLRHVQHDPVHDTILHVDFERVSLDERIEARIPLHFVGEALGVKIEGGLLLHLLESLPVTCRVADIVESIEVDISKLAKVGSILDARDVNLPPDYSLAIDPDEPIAKIAAPRVEVPVIPVVEAVPAAPVFVPAAEAAAPPPEA